ncbi:hypothetical protein [Nocardia sp. CA-120079]|uniref:hypothetical protein n=1 Tax=Nocardia sp. CA-120079 TaxID=3239974 RepID=UPI003D963275
MSGFIVMRPLPHHVDESAVFRALSPAKDIEAVHPVNAGLLALGAPRYVPSTAASVFHIRDPCIPDYRINVFVHAVSCCGRRGNRS